MSFYNYTVSEHSVSDAQIASLKTDERVMFWIFTTLAMAVLVCGYVIFFDLVCLAIVAVFGEGVISLILLTAATIGYLFALFSTVASWITDRAMNFGLWCADKWSWVKSKLGFGKKEAVKSGTGEIADNLAAVAGIVLSVDQISRIAARAGKVAAA